MGRIILIILLLASFVSFGQTFNMKDSRVGDTVQRIIQTTKANGIVKYLLITGTDTAQIRWDGTSLNMPPVNSVLIKTATNYTPTINDSYIIFTNTASGNDTCFLTGLATGQVLTILIGDGTNDVVLNASTLTEDGLTNITNYNLQNYVRSAVVIHEGSDIYHIMLIAN